MGGGGTLEEMTQPPYQYPGFPPPGQGGAPGGSPEPYGLYTGEQGAYGQQPHELYTDRAQAAGGQPAISDFAPPRPRASLVVAVIAAFVALLVVLFFVTRPATTTPGGQPSAQPSSSWGLPFVSQDGSESGQWQIVDSQWESDGLHATIRIAVQRGPLQVAFMAFANDTTETIEPLPSADFPLDYDSALQSGEDRTGVVVFPMPRGDATVILGDYWGDQISALPVAG